MHVIAIFGTGACEITDARAMLRLDHAHGKGLAKDASACAVPATGPPVGVVSPVVSSGAVCSLAGGCTASWLLVGGSARVMVSHGYALKLQDPPPTVRRLSDHSNKSPH